MKKKNQTEEPAFYVSALNTQMLNYRVYVMSGGEKFLILLLTFIIGGAMGLLFYGGLFKEDGQPTMATYISNFVVFLMVGGCAAKIFVPVLKDKRRRKRLSQLKLQFRDFLAAFSTSLSGGMNVNDSMLNAYNDLKLQFSEDAYIVLEVQEMINGMKNNIAVESMMEDFGKRSGVEDISNFAIVFATCYRTGGNLKDIIQRTNSIIGDKLSISEEIETKLTSNKSQMSAMNVIPVVVMLLMRLMSPEFAASFASITGVTAITIAAGMFIASYILGQKIMDIKG